MLHTLLASILLYSVPWSNSLSRRYFPSPLFSSSHQSLFFEISVFRVQPSSPSLQYSTHPFDSSFLLYYVFSPPYPPANWTIYFVFSFFFYFSINYSFLFTAFYIFISIFIFCSFFFFSRTQTNSTKSSKFTASFNDTASLANHLNGKRLHGMAMDQVTPYIVEAIKGADMGRLMLLLTDLYIQCLNKWLIDSLTFTCLHHGCAHWYNHKWIHTFTYQAFNLLPILITPYVPAISLT